MDVLCKILGSITRVVNFGFSGCARCGRTWNICKYHITYYDEVEYMGGKAYSSGFFCLCEHCWSRLTPQERLPYYAKAFWGRLTGHEGCPEFSDAWNMLCKLVKDGE